MQHFYNLGLLSLEEGEGPVAASQASQRLAMAVRVDKVALVSEVGADRLQVARAGQRGAGCRHHGETDEVIHRGREAAERHHAGLR